MLSTMTAATIRKRMVDNAAPKPQSVSMFICVSICGAIIST